MCVVNYFSDRDTLLLCFLLFEVAWVSQTEMLFFELTLLVDLGPVVSFIDLLLLVLDHVNVELLDAFFVSEIYLTKYVARVLEFICC